MAKQYSRETKDHARYLRRLGWSLGEISNVLHIPKNTISTWVNAIRLTMEQRKRIKDKEVASAEKGRILAAQAWHIKIEQWQNDIRKKAHKAITPFAQDPAIRKIMCALLYLCEGAKYPSSRFLHFGNTDPGVIRFFLTLLKKSYTIDPSKLRFSLCYRWDQNYAELKAYWSRITRIPQKQCLNAKPDKRTQGKPTLRKDYKGVCRVIYYDTALQFELQTIGELLIKNGAGGARTLDPNTASVVRSQLRYSPIYSIVVLK